MEITRKFIPKIHPPFDDSEVNKSLVPSICCEKEHQRNHKVEYSSTQTASSYLII